MVQAEVGTRPAGVLVVIGDIIAYTNRKCGANPARRHAWVGQTRDELDVLKWVLASHRLVGESCLTIRRNQDVVILSGGDCEILVPHQWITNELLDI